MLLFLSDEDFNRRIVRGLRRRLPRLDIVRVQDVGLITRPDTEVLEWAANENRVVLTHDVTTMSKHTLRRSSFSAQKTVSLLHLFDFQLLFKFERAFVA